MKKIMILGAGMGQLPLIKRAKSQGYYTIVVSPSGHYPGFELCDKCLYEDISNKEAVLALAYEEKIDAIATDQTDISVPTVQYVAKQMGLPHIECSNIDNFHYKSAMRIVCERNGIKTPPFIVTNKIDDARFFLEELGSTAIIKPVDSQGSRGVHKISMFDEVEFAFCDAQRYSKTDNVIIEKYIVGQEIEVDSVFNNGKLCVTLIGDVYNFGVKDAFSAYERIYPTVFSSEIQNKIIGENEFIVRSLGLSSGWTHGEYMVTPDGEIYLLEVGARGGGNFIGSDIVRIMLGVGTDEMSFQTAIGNHSFYKKISLRNVFCAYKCFYLPSGIIQTIDIADGSLDRESIVCHNLDDIKAGQKVGPNTDKTSRYTIVFKAFSREQLLKELSMIEKQIRIIVLTDKNTLEGIIWR